MTKTKWGCKIRGRGGGGGGGGRVLRKKNRRLRKFRNPYIAIFFFRKQINFFINFFLFFQFFFFNLI